MLDHFAPLCLVALEPELWRWTSVSCTTPDELRKEIESALTGRDRGDQFPFATIDVASGQVVGSTRYGSIDLSHRRLEIGWTYVGTAWQRTAINTEAKFLLLRHAFETLGCMRVEFKTDALNAKSRAAIARIGGVEEGTFRQHMVTSTGRLRDTVYFSILDREWPDVSARLLERLAPGTNQSGAPGA